MGREIEWGKHLPSDADEIFEVNVSKPSPVVRRGLCDGDEEDLHF